MKRFNLLIPILFLFNFNANSQFGHALDFNGISDYVKVDDNAAFDLTSNFTIETWIHTRQLSGTHVLVRKGNCLDSQNSYYVSITDGKIRVLWDATGYCGDTPSYYETSEAVIKAGECCHISVVHTASYVKVYINNELVSGSLMGGSYGLAKNSTAPLTLGNYIDIDGNKMLFYAGEMDEVRFWNYALTQPEIEGYSMAPLTGSESGLVAYYDMEDDGIGTSISLVNKADFSDIPDGITYGSAVTPYFILSACGKTNEVAETQASLLSLYPNPTNGIVTISCNQQPNLIEVLSLDGKSIMQVQNTYTLDLSGISAGTYLVKVLLGQEQILERIVVQ